MAYKKAQDLLLDTYKVMGLVSGTAVQVYSEPQVYAAIQQIFDLVFKKRFWDHLTDWHTVVIDGVSGLATTDMDTFLKDHTDIEKIKYSDFTRTIVRPIDVEHRRVTGASAMYWEPIKYDANNPDLFLKKMIRFWPLTSTTSVAIRCRSKPDDFIPTDYVPFDSAVIAHGAAWSALDNDGINPVAAEKAQKMFDLMYIDYVSADGESDIGLGSDSSYEPLSIRTI